LAVAPNPKHIVATRILDGLVPKATDSDWKTSDWMAASASLWILVENLKVFGLSTDDQQDLENVSMSLHMPDLGVKIVEWQFFLPSPPPTVEWHLTSGDMTCARTTATAHAKLVVIVRAT
jgi:hypothetical protein